MNRYRSGLLAAGVLVSGIAFGEVVITSPTGLPDERDVALEKTVDAVKTIPADTADAVAGSVGFVVDELRNTAHGIAAPFKKDVEQQTADSMLTDVSKAWKPGSEVEMRAFNVNEKMAKELTELGTEGAAVLDVRSFFMGIRFPKGTSAFFRPDLSRLVVCQTPENLRAVEAMLGRFEEKPDYRQVEIKTKFAEVEQKALDELGFNWQFNDNWKISDKWTANLVDQTLSGTLRSASSAFAGAGTAGTMALTKNGWLPLDLTIRALEQSGGADVLSAPSVTTMDGETATISVGDKEMIPESFDTSSLNTSLFVEHSDWQEQNVGVFLEVTPQLMEQGEINLKINAEVVDLVGYDTYPITPANAKMLVWAGANSSSMNRSGRYPIPNIPGVSTAYEKIRATLGGDDPNEWALQPNNTYFQPYYDSARTIEYDEGEVVPQLTGSLPVHRIRKIESNLTVADGSTVGMGGLMYEKLETFKDKVPVLGSIPLIGRLFRSEGERSVKRNLLVLVTATQVDVNGRRSSEIK